MARRKRGGIAEFFEGFNQGYNTVGKVLSDMEMRKIANAKPEVSTTLNEKNAPNGKTYDSDTGQYVATGGAESVEEAAPQRPEFDATTRTNFLGKTYDQPLDEKATDRARLIAMAGVKAKFGDPMAAIQMRQQVTQADMAEKQSAAMDRQAKREDKADAYETGKADLFKQSRYAAVYDAGQKYQADSAAYQERLRSAGNDPEKLAALGPAPTKPDVSYGVIDSLHDKALGIAYDIQHGRGDLSRMTEFATQMQGVQDEGYVRALRLAQAGASREEIAKAFNASGKLQVTPEQIAEVTDTKTDLGGGAKVPSKVIVLKIGDQVRKIDTARELDSFGKAQEIVERAFKGAELGIKERGAKADERKADAAMIVAGARSSGAGQTVARDRFDQKQWDKAAGDYEHLFSKAGFDGKPQPFDNEGKALYRRMIDVNRNLGIEPNAAAASAMRAIEKARAQATGEKGVLDEKAYAANLEKIAAATRAATSGVQAAEPEAPAGSVAPTAAEVAKQGVEVDASANLDARDLRARIPYSQQPSAARKADSDQRLRRFLEMLNRRDGSPSVFGGGFGN